jgi:chromosome segregation ATPase
MDVLGKLDEMIAAKQSEVSDLTEMKSEVEKLQTGGDDAAMSDLKSQLEKAKADSDAKVKECDALRAAIQTEIDDKKKDTARLEAAVEPIEEAPAPVIPDVPAADPAPASDAPAADPAAAPAVDGPTAGPTAQL